jgi:hypothetical protein
MTMKTAVVLSLLAVGSVSAFAPSQQGNARTASLSATGDLTGMVGVDIESGKKIVSIIFMRKTYKTIHQLRRTTFDSYCCMVCSRHYR